MTDICGKNFENFKSLFYYPITMTLWSVKTGKYGEYEQEMLDGNVIAIGWKNLPDLSKVKDWDELKALYTKCHPDHTKYQIANRAGQVWSFVNKIKIGDLVAVPLKSQPSIKIAKVTDNYEYDKDAKIAKHRRKIIWKDQMPRSAFDQDILYAFSNMLTVGQVRNETAEQRVKNMLEHDVTQSPKPDPNDDSQNDIDLERISKDTIIKLIEEKFYGHDLEKLVEGIFIAKGYTTESSSPGPDGGVDILVSSGNLGFDDPKICIQVKSSRSPVDVNVLRALDGVLKNFGANYAILVAWGGLTDPARKEIRRSFFTTKLWDQDKIVEELLENYDNLPSDLKLKIPLKKIWTKVIESTD